MIKTFANTVDGRAAAASEPAVDGRKEVLFEASGRRILVYTGPDAPAKTVPSIVTRFQALAALEIAGKLTAVEAVIANPATSRLAKLAWDNALTFERTSPTLNALAAQIGMTDADLDALFVAAEQITA